MTKIHSVAVIVFFFKVVNNRTQHMYGRVYSRLYVLESCYDFILAPQNPEFVLVVWKWQPSSLA